MRTTIETLLLRGDKLMKGSHSCLKKATYPSSSWKASQPVKSLFF